jgi:hypothetical protein
MNIVTGYREWKITEGNSLVIDVTVTHREIDRGIPMGKTEEFGSIVSLNNNETEITITDRKHPNCESSLFYILMEHARQIQLGTFGKVSAPHHTETDRLWAVLHRLGETSTRADVSDFKQIPVFLNGKQIWEFRRLSDGALYQVFRKYDSYYTTKVVRVLDCYEHPFRDGVPEGNVIKRREVVEYTSTFAEPFDFEKEIPRLFS